VIGFDPSLQQVSAAQWLEQHARGATLVLRSRELADMQAAATSGVGLALLPCLAADAEPGLQRLTPRVLVRLPLSLVYPREARLSQPVQAVIGFVLDVAREHASRIAGTRD
jgi:DNA-binding transcriptional LysR family regulator